MGYARKVVMGEDVAAARCHSFHGDPDSVEPQGLKARHAPGLPVGEVVAGTQVLRPKVFAAACEA